MAAPLVVAACGGGSGSPLESGPFRSDDFPEGGAFLAGVVLAAGSGALLANVPVTLTPDEGLSLAEELASETQAEVRSDRSGGFAFGEIAPGNYVLFVRFDAAGLGYDEVVARVEASATSTDLRISITPIALSFFRPADGGTVAPADTAILQFRPIRLEDRVTLTPETSPLKARVEVHGTAPTGGGSGENIPSNRPRIFEAPLSVADVRDGDVRVAFDVGDLGDPLRLEGALELFLVYRDPRGPVAREHEIRGRAISVVSR